MPISSLKELLEKTRERGDEVLNLSTLNQGETLLGSSDKALFFRAPCRMGSNNPLVSSSKWVAVKVLDRTICVWNINSGRIMTEISWDEPKLPLTHPLERSAPLRRVCAPAMLPHFIGRHRPFDPLCPITAERSDERPTSTINRPVPGYVDTMAVCPGDVLAISRHQFIRTVNVTNGKIIKESQANPKLEQITGMFARPDSRLIYWGRLHSSQQTGMYITDTGFEYIINNEITAIAALPKGGFVHGESNGSILFWEPGVQVRQWSGHQRDITSLVVTEEGNIVSSSLDGTVKVWEAPNGKCIKTKTLHRSLDSMVVLKGNVIAGVSYDAVVVLDVYSDADATFLQSQVQKSSLLARLSDDRVMTTRLDSNGVQIWKLPERQLIGDDQDVETLLDLLPTMSKLKKLDLAGCPIFTAAGASKLKRVYRFIDIILKLTKLHELDLSATFRGDAISNEAGIFFEYLLNHSDLETVKFFGNNANLELEEKLERIGDIRKEKSHFLQEKEEKRQSVLKKRLDKAIIDEGKQLDLSAIRPNKPGVSDFPVPSMLFGHYAKVTALTSLPGGKLASADDDGTIIVWDTDKAVSEKKLIATEAQHIHIVTPTISIPRPSHPLPPPSTPVAQLAPPLSLQFRIPDLPKQIQRVITIATPVRAITSLPNGDIVAVYHDGIRVWDLSEEKVRRKIEVKDTQYTCFLALFSNTDGVIAIDCLGIIHVLNVDTGEQLDQINLYTLGIKGSLNAVTALSDGRLAIKAEPLRGHPPHTFTVKVSKIDSLLKPVSDVQRHTQQGEYNLHAALADGRHVKRKADEDYLIEVSDQHTISSFGFEDLAQRKNKILALVPLEKNFLLSVFQNRSVSVWDMETNNKSVDIQGTVLLPNKEIAVPIKEAIHIFRLTPSISRLVKTTSDFDFLLKALSHMAGLTTLLLRGNAIEVEQLKKLSAAIEKNKTLQKLDLSSTSLTDEGADILLASLKRHESLERISCEDNPQLSHERARQLTEMGNMRRREEMEIQLKKLEEKHSVVEKLAEQLKLQHRELESKQKKVDEQRQENERRLKESSEKVRVEKERTSKQEAELEKTRREMEEMRPQMGIEGAKGLREKEMQIEKLEECLKQGHKQTQTAEKERDAAIKEAERLKEENKNLEVKKEENSKGKQEMRDLMVLMKQITAQLKRQNDQLERQNDQLKEQSAQLKEQSAQLEQCREELDGVAEVTEKTQVAVSGAAP